jgi:hypothetical protein
MVVGYLNDHGYPHAERRRLKGSADQGDITGIPGVVIEVKGDRANRIAKWREETVTEAFNASVEFYFLVVRVERRPVAEWDVHIPMDFLAIGLMEDVWVRMDLADAVTLMNLREY